MFIEWLLRNAGVSSGHLKDTRRKEIAGGGAHDSQQLINSIKEKGVVLERTSWKTQISGATHQWRTSHLALRGAGRSVPSMMVLRIWGAFSRTGDFRVGSSPFLEICKYTEKQRKEPGNFIS